MRSSYRTTPNTIAGCKDVTTHQTLTNKYMRKPIFTSSLLLASALAWGQPKSLSGFDETSTHQQLQLESTYDGYLSAANIDRGIRIRSPHPHHVGPPGNTAVVDCIYNKSKRWGNEARTETFNALVA